MRPFVNILRPFVTITVVVGEGVSQADVGLDGELGRVLEGNCQRATSCQRLTMNEGADSVGEVIRGGPVFLARLDRSRQERHVVTFLVPPHLTARHIGRNYTPTTFAVGAFRRSVSPDRIKAGRDKIAQTRLIRVPVFMNDAKLERSVSAAGRQRHGMNASRRKSDIGR